MRNRWMYALATGMLAVLSLPAMAGGFGIKLSPVINAPKKAPKAVVLVEQAGCVAFSAMDFTITVERLEDGKRRSLPVKFTRLSDEQLAIEQTWPSEAGWTLVVRAKADSNSTQAVAKLDSTGKPVTTRDKKTDQVQVAATYFYAHKPMKDSDLEKILASARAEISSKSN